MSDSTEAIRREMIATGQPAQDLAEEIAKNPDGECWTLEELRRDFVIVGFAAPYVVVKRKSDGVLGSMEFTHSPRIYFNWKED